MRSQTGLSGWGSGSAPSPSQVARKLSRSPWPQQRREAPPPPGPGAGGDKSGWHLPGVKEGCWLGQVDAARGGEREPARPPAPGTVLLLSPARLRASAARRGPGAAVAAAVAVVVAARAPVCVRARSHCSISASACAPPSSRLRSLAGSGPQPTLGGPGDGFLLPPSRPLPVPTLLALPHLLSFKDQGASQGARGVHNAWVARPRGAVWPARPSPPSLPSPEPKGLERGAAGREKKVALAPQILGTHGGKLFASPRSPLTSGRHVDQTSPACCAGQVGWRGTSIARPICSSLLFP